MHEHTSHIVHALPDLHITGGRLGDVTFMRCCSQQQIEAHFFVGMQELSRAAFF